MPNNPTKILLLATLIGGILISISSNSWLGAWMGLEINLMSFIPLMSSQEDIYTTEASLKYFLIQALASSTLLFLVIMKALINQPHTLTDMSPYLIMTPLLLKMGAAPLHWWFPSVMEGLSWMNNLLLMTAQKVAPMVLASYLVKASITILMIILISVIVGSLGGMNQTSLRKILTYSSINHTGWMLTAMLEGIHLWVVYFTVYLILTSTMTLTAKSFNISFVNQTMSATKSAAIKILLFMALLSLGGLPPFIGFLPKWLVIQMLIANNFSFMMAVMVMASLVTLYYYLRVCYSSFTILFDSPKWTFQNKPDNKIIMYGVMLSSMSMLGLLTCTMVMSAN
uniref:NADH-ubiquinone oxidoreductase chain 2 n=1 Tax=Calcaritermes sp. TaxID=2942753 RepID=A0A8X8M2B4_9NEOP|nr:NADH dehydrogenase subunit 2 [Calcaritermes sp.]